MKKPTTPVIDNTESHEDPVSMLLLPTPMELSLFAGSTEAKP